MGWIKPTLITSFFPSKAAVRFFLSVWKELAVYFRSYVFDVFLYRPKNVDVKRLIFSVSGVNISRSNSVRQLLFVWKIRFRSGCSEYKEQQTIFVFIRFVITVVIQDHSNGSGHLNCVTKFLFFLSLNVNKKLTSRHRGNGSNPSVRSQSSATY